ncbi:16S rRNA (guanine(527)-N(7))-methyltransferase RsmG [Lachnospiraceae bacterium 62-35]
MKEKFKTFMTQELNREELPLKESQIEQFFEYYQMIIEKNKVMNLTAITELEDVIIKHFIDSLSLIRAFPMEEKMENGLVKMIDIGTGAGFPGIPLKIVFPDLNITLLDSLNKRVIFLNEVIEQLHLVQIEAVHGRAEDFGRNDKFREKYDLCVSRAVANLSTLSEYCMPFVKKGGYFISYKSGKLEEELLKGRKAVKKLGGVIEEIVTFTLSNSNERSLVKVRKTENISKTYPRKAGLPLKEPLG